MLSPRISNLVPPLRRTFGGWANSFKDTAATRHAHDAVGRRSTTLAQEQTTCAAYGAHRRSFRVPYFLNGPSVRGAPCPPSKTQGIRHSGEIVACGISECLRTQFRNAM